MNLEIVIMSGASQEERQIPCDIIYMSIFFLNVQMSLLTKQRVTDVENKHTYEGGRGDKR